jgi:hypothetical protein
VISCPHGDPTCPCVDGDSCHYEPPDPCPCPNPPHERCDTNLHCHVEGCRYEMTDQDGCGLAKLGRTWSPSGAKMTDFMGTPEWACGAVRFVMYDTGLWFAKATGRDNARTSKGGRMTERRDRDGQSPSTVADPTSRPSNESIGPGRGV